jgi:hypothetical protein
MHSSLDLYLSLLLLCDSELFLSSHELGIFVISLLSKIICSLPSKPCSNAALYVKCGIFSLLGPHLGTKVILVRLDDLVFSSVHVEPSFFALNSEANIHLDSHFSHHDGRFGFVLVGLHHPFVFLWVIISLLIGLSEGMVVCLSGSIVSETTKVGFHLVCFLDLNSHTFYLFKKMVCF